MLLIGAAIYWLLHDWGQLILYFLLVALGHAELLDLERSQVLHCVATLAVFYRILFYAEIGSLICGQVNYLLLLILLFLTILLLLLRSPGLAFLVFERLLFHHLSIIATCLVNLLIRIHYLLIIDILGIIILQQKVNLPIFINLTVRRVN